jgi:outer membrane cobalamin receptor
MKRFLTTISVLFLFIASVLAQPANGQGQGGNMPKIGVLSGKVIDEGSKSPVEFASVILYSVKDSSMVSGTITDASGSFSLQDLPMGKFYADVKFIGYEHMIIDDIRIFPKQPVVNLGTINLKVTAEEIGEVNVVADRTQIQYKLDKKVINVGQDLTAAGGSAVDVLEKSPSVQTDIDGNVTLRGSSSFTVFIDGKPSILQGSDALQQIPASEIQSIEIITNPSAKYDPDGVAGIINVIMKKNRTSGVSGLVNASIGTNQKYKADALVNFHTSKMNWFVGANYRDYNFFGNSVSERTSYLTDQTNYLNNAGSRNMVHGGSGVKTGFDYTINNNQSLSMGVEYGNFEFGRNSNSLYTSWNSLDATKNYYQAIDNFKVSGPYYSANMTYQYSFSKPGNILQAQVNWSNRNGDEYENVDQYNTDANGIRIDNLALEHQTTEKSNENNLEAKVDYTLPLGENRRFEAGYQGKINGNLSKYNYQDYDATLSQWITNSVYSNDMQFDRNIHAAYATYADQLFGFDYMLGIRGEYTFRNFTQLTSNETYKIERFDYFPSVHFSRDLGHGYEAQISYSRRIQRPRDRSLNPYPSFSDEFSVQQGNPLLGPEYVDSYEFNFIKKIGNSSLSIETYLRNGKDVMDRISYLLPDGRLMSTWDNIAKDRSLGAEFMANIAINKTINIMASTDLYKYSMEGVLLDAGQSVQTSSYNMDARLNATFKFKTNTRFQANAFYRGPSVEAQGKEEAMFFTNVAVKQSLLKDQLGLTLSIRDPFNTMKHESSTTTSNYASVNSFSREGAVFEFSVSYKINNYKAKRQKGENGNGEDMNFGEEMQ